MKEVNFDQLQEKIYTETLDNGLKVVILPKRGFSKTFVTFTTKYGSIDRTSNRMAKMNSSQCLMVLPIFLSIKCLKKKMEMFFRSLV